jgi:hypothetical protein
MQVIIGHTDVTSAVQESTYKIDDVKKYTAWTNANNIEKHSNLHHKIEGSFDMVFMPGYSMSYADFLTLVAANTVADITTLTLTVNNLDGAVRTINCFLDISFSPMRDPKNGSGIIVKRCTCKIKEC